MQELVYSQPKKPFVTSVKMVSESNSGFCIGTSWMLFSNQIVLRVFKELFAKPIISSLISFRPGSSLGVLAGKCSTGH